MFGRTKKNERAVNRAFNGEPEGRQFGHDTFDIRTEDMPQEMSLLLEDYPRDGWETHPGFKSKTRHWLGAHQIFRQLAKTVRKDSEAFLGKSLSARRYSRRLSYYGSTLIGNLHGHHDWEDLSYFPELSAADPRFDAGLEILEKDHETLDGVLNCFAGSAESTLQLTGNDSARAYDAAGQLHSVAEAIEAFLARHLADEEDLAVPIILHHRLRG